MLKKQRTQWDRDGAYDFDKNGGLQSGVWNAALTLQEAVFEREGRMVAAGSKLSQLQEK